MVQGRTINILDGIWIKAQNLQLVSLSLVTQGIMALAEIWPLQLPLCYINLAGVNKLVLYSVLPNPSTATHFVWVCWCVSFAKCLPMGDVNGWLKRKPWPTLECSRLCVALSTCERKRRREGGTVTTTTIWVILCKPDTATDMDIYRPTVQINSLQ